MAVTLCTCPDSYLTDVMRNKSRQAQLQKVMREVNPQETTSAYAFDMCMTVPMQTMPFSKTLGVLRIVRVSKEKYQKFNMLMCRCVDLAARLDKEFFGVSGFFRWSEGDVGA